MHRASFVFFFVNIYAFTGTSQKLDWFIDPRDDKRYHIITFDLKDKHHQNVERTWFAHNLDYESKQSFCYKGYDEYCNTFGRLYSWHDALEVCPAGWHLATALEWRELLEHHGGLGQAGIKLQDTVQFKFHLEMGGFGEPDGSYYDAGLSAYFWDAEPHSPKDAGLIIFMKDVSSVQHKKVHAYHKNSVRCVRDYDEKNNK